MNARLRRLRAMEGRVAMAVAFAAVALLAMVAFLAGCGSGASGEIQGTVTVYGDPASAAKVGLFPVLGQAERGQPLDQTTTDAQGGYEFSELEEDEYTLVIDVELPGLGSCRIISPDNKVSGVTQVKTAVESSPSSSPGLLPSGEIIQC